MADKKNFKITPVFGNSLLMGFGAVLLGLKSISNSGFLGSWDIGQILIFVSYTFGLFSLVSFMAGMIFLIYPLFKNLKKTSIGLFILIDSLLLIFLISDSYIYPLYRTHLNFAMIQMTLLGGGRIVAFSPRMLGEIGLMIVGILVFSYLFARLSFYFSRHRKTVYALFAFGLIGFAVSNFSYSWGFANFNNRLISVFDKIPLARPLRMNTLLQKYGFVDRKAIDTKKVNLSEGGLMNYH